MPTNLPKDFAGKNKTKDTYDKDWVFVKNRHTKGPNHSAGAWMTKRQRRDLMEERRANRMNNAAVPPPTPDNSLVPILPPPTPLKKDGPIPTLVPPPTPAPPDWWINQAYKNPTNPEQQFANMANAILPTLSPEDQRSLASYLASKHKDVFGKYSGVNFGKLTPTEMTDDLRQKFLSPDRAKHALSLLDKMKQATGGANLGAGYDFLRNAVGLMNQFSTGGVMTREKYAQFQAAVANLGKNATGDLSAYGNLAQLFNLPSFTAGPLVSNAPNNKLFS